MSATGHVKPVVGRFWTTDGVKAACVASEAPGRTLLEFPLEEVPPEVRANIERAERERAASH
jgi:hypothetical protein